MTDDEDLYILSDNCRLCNEPVMFNGYFDGDTVTCENCGATAVVSGDGEDAVLKDWKKKGE